MCHIYRYSDDISGDESVQSLSAIAHTSTTVLYSKRDLTLSERLPYLYCVNMNMYTFRMAGNKPMRPKVPRGGD